MFFITMIVLLLYLDYTDKKNVSNYIVIDADTFNYNANIEHIFLKGKFVCNEPVTFKDKEYAFIRHTHYDYFRSTDVENFDYSGTIWEEDLLTDVEAATSYDLDIGTNFQFGNLKLTNNDLNIFKPYVILQQTISNKQDIYSVIDKEFEGIIYIDSVKNGTINDIEYYRNLDEAINGVSKDYTIFIFLDFIICFIAIIIYGMIVSPYL